MRALPPLGLTSLLVLLVACGGAGDDTPRDAASPADDASAAPVTPVEPSAFTAVAPRDEPRWRLPPDSPAPPAAVRQASFALIPGEGPGPEGWTAEALRAARMRLPGSGEILLVMRSPRPALALKLTHEGELPAASEVLRLTAAFEGTGAARVELWRGDERVAQGPELLLAQRDELGAFLVPLPAERPPHDRVVLDVAGQTRRLALSELHFETRVPGAGLPTVQAPELVERGGRWLSAGVLHGGASVTLDAELPAGRALEFALAAPPGAVGARVLTLELRPVGGEGEDAWTARELQVPTDDAWLPVRVDPADAPRELRLRGDAAPERPTLLAAARLVPEPAVEPAPLVLLVTSGSHRGDHLGLAFRGVDMPTPTLDALAEQGVLFADAQTSSNHAAPALGALFTGLPPRDTQFLSAGQQLLPAARTLAEVFVEAGFHAAAVVGGSHLTPSTSGLGQGFHELQAPELGALWSAEQVVTRALELLDRERDAPLFLWVALTDGRWPHDPAPESLARFYDERDRAGAPLLPNRGRILKAMPESFREQRDMNELRARYKAGIAELDSALTPLLERPRVRAGVRAFVGDHGLAMGEHRTWFKPRGLYPAVLHVPLLLAAAQLPRTDRREDPVSTLDLGRTLLDLAGQRERAFPGRSLLAVRGPDAPRFAVECDGDAASITTGKEHLVLHLRAQRIAHLPERFDAFELEHFDLRDDPVAAEALPGPDSDPPAGAELLARRTRLRDTLTAWLRAAPAASLAAPGLLDPLLEQERLALGYTGPSRTPSEVLLDVEACPWCDDA